jgi:hypothetical protein
MSAMASGHVLFTRSRAKKPLSQRVLDSSFVFSVFPSEAIPRVTEQMKADWIPVPRLQDNFNDGVKINPAIIVRTATVL